MNMLTGIVAINSKPVFEDTKSSLRGASQIALKENCKKHMSSIDSMLKNDVPAVNIALFTGVSTATIKRRKKKLFPEKLNPSNQHIAKIIEMVKSKPAYTYGIGDIAKAIGVSVPTTSSYIKESKLLSLGCKAGIKKKVAFVK